MVLIKSTVFKLNVSYEGTMLLFINKTVLLMERVYKLSLRGY
jgi:hypothetical protein